MKSNRTNLDRTWDVGSNLVPYSFLEARPAEDPTIAEDLMVVAGTLLGMCSIWWSFWAGHPPQLPGHLQQA